MTKRPSQSSFRNDSPAFLQQKIIHYRSEISRYQNMLDQYEKELERSKKKNELLLKDLVELKNKEPELVDSEKTEVLPYFSYSLILPQIEEEEKNILVIGNFILKNTGTTSLKTPVICIKIEPNNQNCSLSGKIKMATLESSDDGGRIYEESATEEWVYVYDNWRDKIKESGEYWLRPTHQDKVEPGAKLTFSNFNLSISPEEMNRSVIVSGFVYFEELRDGVPVLNQIVINY